MFEPTRRLLAVPLVRALALECFRIEEELGAKFLRGVRMSLLAARGTCKLSFWPNDTQGVAVVGPYTYFHEDACIM